MAQSLQQADKLGVQMLNFSDQTNLDAFPVRVKRQDSTIENVMLMDEMVAFLDKEMPNAVDNYMAYPQTFEYNQEALAEIQGFPEEARTRFSRPARSGPRDNEQILKEEWRKRALGDSSEAKTFLALQTLLQSRPSLLLSGVTVERVQRSFDTRGEDAGGGKGL